MLGVDSTCIFYDTCVSEIFPIDIKYGFLGDFLKKRPCRDSHNFKHTIATYGLTLK